MVWYLWMESWNCSLFLFLSMYCFDDCISNAFYICWFQYIRRKRKKEKIFKNLRRNQEREDIELKFRRKNKVLNQ